MSNYYAGNLLHYVINDLVIPTVPLTNIIEIQVTLPGVKIGDSGFACPRNAIWTARIIILPIRVTADNIAQLPFSNPSAASLDPPNTYDFDVYIFKSTGAIQATIG